MEIKFKASKNEFKDLFFYENKKNNGIVKMKKRLLMFSWLYFICSAIFILKIEEFILMWVIVTLICAIGIKIFFADFFYGVLIYIKWDALKKSINIPQEEISVHLTENQIILYGNEENQYKVSLKNVEIPRIDKTKIYLKIEGRTLYYIPLNAFSSEDQKNEFINIINKK